MPRRLGHDSNRQEPKPTHHGPAVDSVKASGSVPELLTRLRNMWQFANLAQWVYLFGKAAKIDDRIDIEELETESQKPSSELFADIGLCLLKLISPQRPIGRENLTEQIRKQYAEKLPHMNPLGSDEATMSFQELDIFAKIRILQQLTQWAMLHPERIREKMDEQRDVEQASWRIEPFGWDRDDHTYFVLDDNRLYRLRECPAHPEKKPTKKLSKAYRVGSRSSKRRRISSNPSHEVAEEDGMALPNGKGEELQADEGLGNMKWECVAVGLREVQAFVEMIQSTKDENEKVLRDQLRDYLIPILEKQEEARLRKLKQKERDVLISWKMANAKRSSRIANRIEQTKQDEHRLEEEQRRFADDIKARKMKQEQTELIKEQEMRANSRAQRKNDREKRKARQVEELAQLSEGSVTGRISERQRLANIERHRREIEALEQEDEDWYFDCICGVVGHVDDGTHSIACEKCGVWQHSKCVDVPEEEADSEDFHFICASCTRSEVEANSQSKATKIRIKVPRSDCPQSNPVPRNGRIVVEIATDRARHYSPMTEEHVQSNLVENPAPSPVCFANGESIGAEPKGGITFDAPKSNPNCDPKSATEHVSSNSDNAERSSFYYRSPPREQQADGTGAAPEPLHPGERQNKSISFTEPLEAPPDNASIELEVVDSTMKAKGPTPTANIRTGNQSSNDKGLTPPAYTETLSYVSQRLPTEIWSGAATSKVSPPLSHIGTPSNQTGSLVE